MPDTTKQPGDSFSEVKKSRIAQATGSEAASMLCPGTTYTAQITSRQADGTYTVTVDDPKVDLNGVRVALPVFGGLLGLQVKAPLPALTKVKMVYGSPPFIYATVPELPADGANSISRSLLWGQNMDAEMGVTENTASDQAEDLLEGEVEFTNLYGVSMEFLTTIMRMSAGDRAAVECHLINDMVRVISGQYRHVSGLGEDLIFDHGRPTRERNWSSYRHEVLGKLKEKDPYATMNGDEVDRDEVEAGRVTALGRSRFREFVGYAGDFIHSFVTDPPATAVSLVQGAAASGAGKSWMHRNSDGSVLIQSTADIRLERVCRIPVPVRYAHHEDPTVTAAREYDKLNADFLKLPQALSPADPLDTYQLAYHIRSYSRWLGRYHSFARMLQLDGEYEIPSEAASPAPDWNNGEEDRQDKNKVDYYDAYACISIMRDGSIVTQDGYGSSLVMSNGNVQISAARHMDLESAGDMRFVCGGNLLMKAKRNIEISAVGGGLILHSYAWLKALCEKGSTWIRSNAKPDKDVAAEPKDDGAPTPEIAGWESGTSDGFGVLVEAVDGAAAYRSQKGITLAVDGSSSDEDDTDYDVTVTTGGNVEVYGKQSAALHSSKVINVSSPKIALAAPTLMSSATEFLMGPRLAEPQLIVRNGRFWCQAVEADNLAANFIQGPEQGPISPDPDPLITLPLKKHFNHINVLPAALESPEGANTEDLADMTTAKELIPLRPTLPWGDPSQGPEWSFPEKEEYMGDSREKVAGAIPETLTQQYLRLDAEASDPDRWGGPGYLEWNLRGSISGRRTGSRSGFGSFESQYKADDSGESLHEPSGTAAADMEEMVTSWRPKDKFSIKALKRDGEV